ncbi:MAG: hypothetical protein A2252_02310 [Elusimicrobia bacterium RIFOXYA2_FULL_39_19]|nr:MAG: hypothetical protein A2252_02310 [Elusimicrobia bacterium RIFOXYA2_FULL_39_19]
MITGKINLKTADKHVVNGADSFVFVYTVGKEEWMLGGHIFICDRHISDFAWIQPGDGTGTILNNSESAGYATVKSTSKAVFEIKYDFYYNTWHPWEHIFQITLKKGSLKEGDRVTIVFGDKSGGAPALRIQSFKEKEFKFRVFIDPERKNEFTELKDKSLSFEILPAKWSDIEVVMPSQVMPDKAGRVVVRAIDQYGNTTALPEGEMFLLVDDRYKVSVPKNGRKKGYVEIGVDKIKPYLKNMVFLDTYVPTEVHLYYPKNKYEIIGNPILQESLIKEKKLFWGEIHGQSYLCDGTYYPDEILKFARDESRLDFAAITSHDCAMENGEKDYQKCVDAANKLNKPKDFTAFIGMEWSGATPKGGDHNIYFKGDKGNFFTSGHYLSKVKAYKPEVLKELTLPPWTKEWMLEVPVHADLAKVYSDADPNETMIIPHGGGRICNMEYHDPMLEPVMEIQSGHAVFEFLACEALQKGYRMGFIAGSDDHRGSLGDSHTQMRKSPLGYTEHSGLVAAYAQDCTRESIWKAFQEKSVYATTGARIILNFKLNDNIMGKSVKMDNPKESRQFKIEVFGTTYIRQVELWRNAQVLKIWRPEWFEHVIEFTDTEPIDKIVWPEKTIFGKEVKNVNKTISGREIKRAQAAYFVKVIQSDGHMAWSSPVWIDVK